MIIKYSVLTLILRSVTSNRLTICNLINTPKGADPTDLLYLKYKNTKQNHENKLDNQPYKDLRTNMENFLFFCTIL